MDRAAVGIGLRDALRRGRDHDGLRELAYADDNRRARADAVKLALGLSELLAFGLARFGDADALWYSLGHADSITRVQDADRVRQQFGHTDALGHRLDNAYFDSCVEFADALGQPLGNAVAVARRQPQQLGHRVAYKVADALADSVANWLSVAIADGVADSVADHLGVAFADGVADAFADRHSVAVTVVIIDTLSNAVIVGGLLAAALAVGLAGLPRRGPCSAALDLHGPAQRRAGLVLEC